MPFASALDEVYHQVIKPTLQGVGLVCQRLDELPDPTLITADIVNYIEGADLIIADLTYANPNVFYELAVTHRTGFILAVLRRLGGLWGGDRLALK